VAALTRVAAVDCGTNSLRLLVTDLDRDAGHAEQVDRRTTIVRLGQGVDRTGVFADEALARTFACVDAYAEVIGGLDVSAVRFVATSAARDVANREAFLDGVRVRLGVDAEIISGHEEAVLSYDGATRELARTGAVDEPVLVVDIGGGSTEFVIRTSAEGPVHGCSVDIGSVRLTERHLADDPPTAAQVAAVRRDVRDAIDTVDVALDDARTLVGVAGTITTMAAMVLDLAIYDREQVNGAHLARDDVLSAVDEIVAMTVEQRRALPFMHPDRADVIGAGALVLAGVVERLDLPELRVSSHDILDGIAWSLVTRDDGPA
jgi:exopolyphosphatase/guanosine-5'-triphosphate,3'-diphosphate pyrophosphatase